MVNFIDFKAKHGFTAERRFYISTFCSFWRILINKTGSMIKGMKKNEYSAFRRHEVTYCDKDAQGLMEAMTPKFGSEYFVEKEKERKKVNIQCSNKL